MTVSTRSDALLEEAETIVWAEWMRILHTTAPSDEGFTVARTELPAAPPRPPQVVIVNEMRDGAGALPPDFRQPNRTGDRWSRYRIWPTQRSPPRVA